MNREKLNFLEFETIDSPFPTDLDSPPAPQTFIQAEENPAEGVDLLTHNNGIELNREPTQAETSNQAENAEAKTGQPLELLPIQKPIQEELDTWDQAPEDSPFPASIQIKVVSMRVEAKNPMPAQTVVEEKSTEADQKTGSFTPLIFKWKFLTDLVDIAVPEEEIKIYWPISKKTWGSISEALWEDKIVTVKTYQAKDLKWKDKKWLDNMLMEAKIMWQLGRESDAIVRLLTFAKPVFLVMENMSEGSLFQLLCRGQKLPWNIFYQIALDVAQGLKILHDYGVIHFDLKSCNILLHIVGNCLRAKIADFESAQMEVSITKEEVTPSSFSRAFDIYSFGGLLWEMLTLKTIFTEEENDLQTKEWLAQTDTRDIPIDCPGILAELIGACRNSIPQKRPTAKELVNKLMLLLELSSAPGLASTPISMTDEKPSVLRPLDLEAIAIPINTLPLYAGSYLGSGMYGVVYKWTLNGKEVVIKTMKEQPTSRQELQYMLKEAKIMWQLGMESEHIVQLIKFGLGEPYALVMELMPKGTLHDLIAAGQPLTPELFRQIALDIASGILILHAHLIIHLDLKPSNILLDDRLRAKLGDFGKAEIEQKIFDGQVVATPAWMAPELFSEDGRPTRACDIYSFAWILWSMLTRITEPFSHLQNAFQKMEAIIQGKRAEIPDGYFPELKKIIRKCWEAIPEKRPRIQEMMDILKELKQSKASTPSISQNLQTLMAVPQELNSKAQLKLQGKLIKACQQGDIKAVENLLSQGAKPDKPSENGEQPFAAAVWGMCPSVVKRLTEAAGGVVLMRMEACMEHNKKYYMGEFIVSSEQVKTYLEWWGLIPILESSTLLKSVHLKDGFVEVCNSLLKDEKINLPLSKRDMWDDWESFEKWLRKRLMVWGPTRNIDAVGKVLVSCVWKIINNLQNQIKVFIEKRSGKDTSLPLNHLTIPSPFS